MGTRAALSQSSTSNSHENVNPGDYLHIGAAFAPRGDFMRLAKVWLAGSASAIAVLAWSAFAQETTTYSYDGLGRLKSSTITGGSNTGRVTGTCFDPAGNRTRYDVTTSVPAACPVPTPTPTPT